MFSKNGQLMLENYFPLKMSTKFPKAPKYTNQVKPGVQVRRVT